MSISNFLGQVVFETQKPKSTIDIGGLSNGIYSLKCVDLDNKTQVVKFIKK